MVDYKTSLAMDNELYCEVCICHGAAWYSDHSSWKLVSLCRTLGCGCRRRRLAAVEESLIEVVVPHYAAAGSALR